VPTGQVDVIETDLQLKRMLLVDWFAHLGVEAGYPFTQYGTSGRAFTVGGSQAFHVTAHYTEQRPYLRFVASEPTKQTQVDTLAHNAIQRIDRREFGGPVWYSTQLDDPGFRLSASFMGSFVERLSAQTRVTGWRRLGRDVLLEFTEVGAEAVDHVMAPQARVKVHIAAPGPRPGHFASHVAHGVLETVASICTFALGRSVALPATIFPTKPAELADLLSRHTNPAVLTLARKHVSLDIFTQLSVPGGLAIFRRERAALTTFAAAMSQDIDLVACMLYVVASECLTMPDTPWRHKQIIRRFLEFFEELIPSALDTIVAHDNFESVFGLRRGSRAAHSLRKRLLDRLYDFRSGLVHGGLPPSYRGLGLAVEDGSTVRRALFADFAEAAILGYLQAPRSTLIGHPAWTSLTRPSS